ncbi:hypothetical protein [Streptomyces sp. WM6386]|uniref:hypothetical protein n=1 Tax=Streptomyces sp. WM6386 TaxID=1415558 RepID=UPI00131D703F|nr:hypothetical protein [Streptomyces sp. WM6386]
MTDIAAASVQVPDVATTVVIFTLVCAGICLALAVIFAFLDNASSAVRKAAEAAAPKTVTEFETDETGRPRARPQTTHVDFSGLAKLAEGLEKLNHAGRFLIVSLAFTAVAAVAAGAGSIAGAVA